MSYSTPKCEKGSKLVKSRCQCKKTKNKTLKKTLKKKVNDKYDEEWALVKGKYSINKPSKSQLKVRRKRIDEVYKLYEKIKKLDKKFVKPQDWQYPPERCYNSELQTVIKLMKKDLKAAEDKII
jgi:hypothetical protein